ncbi:hypothetical protein AB4212_11460, partial [Streptomyces sp. 2MCAF27]
MRCPNGHSCGQPSRRSQRTWQHGGVTAATPSPLFPRVSTPAEYAAVPRDADAVLEGLDPEQREVATALHGPVCV